MADHFDPYHRWLGIPAKHQPADHYRLLGLERFEDDPEVIVDAAERQMAHVRRYALGPNQLLSQQILNELAAAQSCLLDPVKKARYDGDLRQRPSAATLPAAALPPAPTPVPAHAATSPVASSAPPTRVKIQNTAGIRPPVPEPAPVIREVVRLHGGGRFDRGQRVEHRQSRTIRLREWVDERLVAWAGVQTPRQLSVLRALAVGFPLVLVLAGLLVAFGVSGRRHPTMTDSSRSISVGEPARESMSLPPKPEPPPLAVAPFDPEQAKSRQAAWSRHLGQPVEVTNSIGMKLILIPPGEFMMGSPVSEANRSSDETPHRVRINKPYYLGVWEVTHGEYERVMGTKPSRFKTVSRQDTNRFPVEQVSWEDAVEFCRKLSALLPEQSSGRVYRLPTEAEWEYACRAGTTTPFHFGSELNGGEANCDGNHPYGTGTKGPYLARPTTVGSYGANSFGLCDMHGNVWEWCSDWYGDYAVTSVDDPQGPAVGSGRVVRGGSWHDSTGYCRAAARDRSTPGSRSDPLGFRVACSSVDVSGP